MDDDGDLYEQWTMEGDENVIRDMVCEKCGTRWRATFYAQEGCRDWELVRCPQCANAIEVRV